MSQDFNIMPDMSGFNFYGMTQADFPGVNLAQAEADALRQMGGPPPPPSGGGGGGGNTTPVESAADRARREYYENLENDRKESNRQAREGAKSFLSGILNQYGLGSLAANIESLVNDWGTNTEVIAEN